MNTCDNEIEKEVRATPPARYYEKKRKVKQTCINKAGELSSESHICYRRTTDMHEPSQALMHVQECQVITLRLLFLSPRRTQVNVSNCRLINVEDLTISSVLTIPTAKMPEHCWWAIIAAQQ